MLTRTILTVALMQLAYANLEIASTCISQDNPLLGSYSSTDFAFTDFAFLNANEQPNTIYRMTALWLCSDASNKLTGMRSVVGRFDA
jgi:hypothetical protein